MYLEKIKIDKCPSCGADAISEERIQINPTSDNFSERKLFGCGLQLSSKEDCDEIITDNLCTCSEEFTKQSKKRVAAFHHIFKFIRSLNIDDEFKSRLINGLMTVSSR